MKFNLSIDKPYLTQMNNELYPLSTCNVTSSIMALIASDIEFIDPPRYKQLEDDLTALLMSDEAMARKKKLYTWGEDYKPFEIHGMLEWGINQFVGAKVDHFTTGGSIQQILFNIYNRCASVVSGRFTPYGHLVCVVGFETDQESLPLSREDIDLSLVKNIVVDDPYGDYFSEYDDHDGDNISFSLEEFNSITKTYDNADSKWVHYFSKP